MNRRGFFGLLAGALVAPLLPKKAGFEITSITITDTDEFDRALVSMWDAAYPSQGFVVLSPNDAAAIERLARFHFCRPWAHLSHSERVFDPARLPA